MNANEKIIGAENKGVKRILHVLRALDFGGVETRTMELYRNLNTEQIQFDFLTMDGGDHYYNDEVKSLGGRIFVISDPKKAGPIKHLKEMVSVMREYGTFHAVHDHTAYHGGMVVLAARMAGIQNRICHSRSAADWRKTSFTRKVYKTIMRQLILSCSTNLLSCGLDAGRYLYGEKAMKSPRFQLIPNATDLMKYKKKDSKDSIRAREELGIPENTLVIGHIGRHSKEKNHIHILNIAKKLKENGAIFRVVLVGDGIMRADLEKKAIKMGLTKEILFLGFRNDVPYLLNCFDVFVMPSLFEGLPGSVIESQAAGVRCVLSSNITREVDLGLGMVKFLDLNESLNEWCSVITESARSSKIPKEVIINKLTEHGYDIQGSLKKLLNIYCYN